MTFTWTVEKPFWRCGWTLSAQKRSNADRSPFGDAYVSGTAGASASSSTSKRRPSTSKSRSATQSPCSSSSTISRKASIPTLSTSTLMRARARLTRRKSVRSKIRKHASATFRYSPSSSPTNSYSVGAMRGMIDVPPPTRTSTPRMPSRSRARKAMSWMPVSERSASGAPSNAVLILRGIICVVGWRTK